jgi:hypothetical protein
MPEIKLLPSAPQTPEDWKIWPQVLWRFRAVDRRTGRFNAAACMNALAAKSDERDAELMYQAQRARSLGVAGGAGRSVHNQTGGK